LAKLLELDKILHDLGFELQNLLFDLLTLFDMKLQKLCFDLQKLFDL
jgi:hypothetical protein